MTHTTTEPTIEMKTGYETHTQREQTNRDEAIQDVCMKLTAREQTAEIAACGNSAPLSAPRKFSLA